MPLVTAFGDCEEILGDEHLLFEPNDFVGFIRRFDLLISHGSEIDPQYCVSEINRNYSLAACEVRLLELLAD